MKEIKQKIVGVRLKSDEQELALQDVNPLTLRIDRRPNGSLDAVSENDRVQHHGG